MQTTKPETAQQRPTGARMALLMLLYFIKIGAFTFGSGWSIIAQMEREFVDERGWMTKSDLLELIAVGKSLPGIMVANITLLFGYQMAGALGGICAAIGLCIPAVVTLTIVTAIYDAIKDNYWVWSALKGVQCAVAPIIGGAASAVGTELMTTYGPDSYLGRVAAVMLGSTETTFYTIAVYFGSAGIRKPRHTVPAALTADLVGFIASAWAVRLFFP